MYEDRAGFMRLAIERKRRHSTPVCSFHYKVDGHGVLKKLMREFRLCPKLCFIQTDNNECQGIIEGYCDGSCAKKEEASVYNQRVMKAIASLTQRPSYIVLDKGRKYEEQSCIMVLNGSFFGMGYLPKDLSDVSYELIKDYIKPYRENNFIKTLLASHTNQFPEKVWVLSY
jgi:DNA polymerase-3 subunit epsilon